jgi:hypothetical protein
MIIGDRVESNFFGEGNIIKINKDPHYYIVKWDKPPKDRPNPCIVSPYDLKKI